MSEDVDRAADLAAKALLWLGRRGNPTEPDAAAAPAVASAVVEFVDDLPDVDPPSWTPRQLQGAVMLTARLIRRRNSAEGVTAFTEQTGAVYVQRNDPDVAMLLRLAQHKRPRVG